MVGAAGIRRPRLGTIEFAAGRAGASAARGLLPPSTDPNGTTTDPNGPSTDPNEPSSDPSRLTTAAIGAGGTPVFLGLRPVWRHRKTLELARGDGDSAH